MNNLLEGVAGGSSGGGGGGYDWNDETNKSKVDCFLCKRLFFVMFLPPCHSFTSNHPKDLSILVGKLTLLDLELLKGDTESWSQTNELFSNALIEKIFMSLFADLHKKAYL